MSIRVKKRAKSHKLTLSALADKFEAPAMQEIIAAIEQNLLVIGADSSYSPCYVDRIRGSTIKFMREWPADFSPANITKEDLQSWYQTSHIHNYSRAILLILDAIVETGHCPDKLSWIADNLALIKEKASKPSELLMKAVMNPADFGQMVLYNGVNHAADGKELLYLLALDTKNPQIVALIASCLTSRAEIKSAAFLPSGKKFYFEHFTELLGGLELAGPEDIGAETFTAQQNAIEAFDKKSVAKSEAMDAAVCLHLHAFRLRDMEKALTPKNGLCLPFLERCHFQKEWRNGYRAVNYDIADPVPEFDKWVLFPNGTESASISAKPDQGMLFDFSDLDKEAAILCKSWLWHQDASMPTKKIHLRYAKLYFANSDDLSLYSDGESRKQMFVSHASIARALCANKVSDGGRHMKAALKSLFAYGKAHGLVIVQESGQALLNTSSKCSDASDAEPLTEAELSAILVDINTMAEKSLLYKCIFHAIKLECCTPLRISEIFDLKISDIKPLATPGLWRLDRIAKGYRGDSRDIQISRTAKQCIDSILEETAVLRKTAPDVLKDYVFIYDGLRKSVKVPTIRQANKVLGNIGAKYGITCSTKNVRLLYMNHVVEEGLALGLDRLGLRAVTNHTSTAVEDRYYLRPDIRQYVEAMHGVTIGTEPIKGTLAEDASLFAETDLVNGGCGWCRNEECNIEGTAPCLMCSGFITTPENLPELYEAVAVLDGQICESIEPHDKERLIAVKRLYLHYIGLLLTIKEDLA